MCVSPHLCTPELSLWPQWDRLSEEWCTSSPARRLLSSSWHSLPSSTDVSTDGDTAFLFVYLTNKVNFSVKTLVKHSYLIIFLLVHSYWPFLTWTCGVAKPRQKTKKKVVWGLKMFDVNLRRSSMLVTTAWELSAMSTMTLGEHNLQVFAFWVTRYNFVNPQWQWQTCDMSGEWHDHVTCFCDLTPGGAAVCDVCRQVSSWWPCSRPSNPSLSKVRRSRNWWRTPTSSSPPVSPLVCLHACFLSCSLPP